MQKSVKGRFFSIGKYSAMIDVGLLSRFLMHVNVTAIHSGERSKLTSLFVVLRC